MPQGEDGSLDHKAFDNSVFSYAILDKFNAVLNDIFN